MQDLIIEATKYTPHIELLSSRDLLIFRGKSYPENTFDFYAKTLEWIEEYLAKRQNPATLDLDLAYLNSSSSKLFFDLFDLLESHSDKGVKVNWYYDEENESALESGEEFMEDFTKLEFKLIKK
jgi:hypothetical protein